KRRWAETRTTTFADYGAAIDGTPDLDLPDPKSVPVHGPARPGQGPHQRLQVEVLDHGFACEGRSIAHSAPSPRPSPARIAPDTSSLASPRRERSHDSIA